MRFKVLAVPVASLLAGGCANLNSVFRTNDTPAGSAQTILIDAKQRPITVNRVAADKPMTCVGRGADALSQAAASGNLQIKQTSGGSADAGFATAEQVTSIAFRNQVTEAQQEFLYQLCQLSANGVLSAGEVSDNLRHFQNTMLAMVAIDDLASTARPAASTTGSMPDPTKTPAATDAINLKAKTVTQDQSGVDSAKTAVTKSAAGIAPAEKAVSVVNAIANVTAATTKLTAAAKDNDAKQKAYAKALAALNDAIKAQNGTGATVPDDVTSASKKADTDLKDVSTKYAALTTAIAALDKVSDVAALPAAQTSLSTAVTDYSSSSKVYETTEDAYGAALTKWSKATDDADTKSAKDDKTNKAGTGASDTIANDVTLIVQTIVWQSFVTEGCQKLLFTPAANVTVSPEVIRYCLGHMEQGDDVRSQQLLGALVSRQGQNPNPTAPPPNFIPATAGPVPPVQTYLEVDTLNRIASAVSAQTQKQADLAPAIDQLNHAAAALADTAKKQAAAAASGNAVPAAETH